MTTAEAIQPRHTIPGSYFDPFDPTLHADLYARYARARESAAVCQGPYGMAVLTRYAEVSAALRDTRFAHASATPPPRVLSFIGMDPPEHGPLRQTAAPCFGASAVAALAPHVARLTDELLTPALDRQSLDLVSEFAEPLSLRIICGLLGLPETDHAWLRDLIPRTNPLLDPAYAISDSALAQARQAILALTGYLREQITHRRKNPGRDLLSELIAHADARVTLTPAGLVPICVLLLGTGYEPPAHVITNGAHALLTHPDQLDIARTRTANGALDTVCTDELLRYDPPIQMTFRTTQREVVVAGTTLPQATPVALLTGSANRDHRVFPHPDRLDLTRTPNPHLTFGAGIHYCLGSHLARLQARLALGHLLTRSRTLGLTSTNLRHVITAAPIRHLQELPIALTPQ